MPIYLFSDNSLSPIPPTNFVKEKISERHNLQSAIKKNIEVIAPDCLVISEEFSDWEDSRRRIDLLAIDKEANLVVIELKRNDSGDHMELQSIRYSAMISTLTYEKTIQICQQYLDKNNIQEKASKKIEDFLNNNENVEENFASKTRIILVSQDFSKEITTSVMWLNYMGLDITCIKIIPYKYGEQILVDIQPIIPLPETKDYQTKIQEKMEEKREAKSNKDYTKYKFNGIIYNKRYLVLAVIQYFVGNNNPLSLDDLTKTFTDKNLFMELSDAKKTYEQKGHLRHFIEDTNIVTCKNGDKFAISNQWGVGNIPKFIEEAQNIGYEITEIK